jgi:chain length determinant protein EpsF
MSLQQFLSVIRGRWRLIAIMTLVLFALGVAAGFAQSTKYMAQATVLVDVAPDPVSVAGANAQAADYMQTQQDIASSERVAQRVVKSMDANELARFRQAWQAGGSKGDFTIWLATLLRKHVTVPPSPESNVMTIVAKWTNAESAATLANAFAQAYIDTTIELKLQPAKQYSVLFNESAQALRADLEAKQKLLADYESKNGLIVSETRLDSENARLGELSSQLTAIQAQLQDSQSRQHDISGGDDSRPEILQNPLISNLKSDLILAEAKQRDLSTQFGTNHPEYQRNQAVIDTLRERIARETDRVVESLHATTQVNSRRASDIAAALAAQKERVLQLKHQRDEGAVLQNDVVTAQRNLDAVTQRLAQSNLQSQTPQATIAMLTPATPPAAPYSPNIPMNAVIGLLGGAALGIIIALLLEMGDRRIRSDDELVKLLGLPLLGKINAMANEPQRPRRLLLTADAAEKV